jgi:hypothetical protein
VCVCQSVQRVHWRVIWFSDGRRRKENIISWRGAVICCRKRPGRHGMLGRGGAGASRAAEKNNAGPQPASLVRGGGRIAPCCLPAARPLCKLLQVRSMRARAQLRCQATGTRSREFSMPPSASAMPDPGRTSLSPLPLSWIPIDPSNVSNYKAGWQMVDFSFSAIIHYFYFFMVFFPRSSLAPARVMWPLGRPGRPTCWAGDGSGSRGRRTRRVSSYAGCGTARVQVMCVRPQLGGPVSGLSRRLCDHGQIQMVCGAVSCC